MEHRVELLKDHFVFEHLTALLKSNEDERTGSIAVFVRTVDRMNQVSSALEKLGYPTLQGRNNGAPRGVWGGRNPPVLELKKTTLFC